MATFCFLSLALGWGGRIRTFGCGIQSPEPYHLATPQWRPGNAKLSEEVSPTLRERPRYLKPFAEGAPRNESAGEGFDPRSFEKPGRRNPLRLLFEKEEEGGTASRHCRLGRRGGPAGPPNSGSRGQRLYRSCLARSRKRITLGQGGDRPWCGWSAWGNARGGGPPAAGVHRRPALRMREALISTPPPLKDTPLEPF